MLLKEREDGEVNPVRPIVGKVKSGIMFYEKIYGRYLEITNHVTDIS